MLSERRRSGYFTLEFSSVLRLALLLFMAAPVGAARADALTEGARTYVAENYPRSTRILLARAERGDARAQTYVGVMHLRGQGLPQDFRAAAHWLHLAAEADVPAAQYLLGLLYDKGQGVPQDFVIALAWLNLSVAHDEPTWRNRRALIRDAVASKMSQAQLDEAQKLALEWRGLSER